MFWYIAKCNQLKTLNGYQLSDLDVIKQEVLNEERQSSKTLNYQITNKSSKEVKWDRCN